MARIHGYSFFVDTVYMRQLERRKWRKATTRALYGAVSLLRALKW